MESTSRFSLRNPAGLALMLVLGILVGFGVGYAILRETVPGDSSAEAGFARDMSTHHAQAVQMAMIAQQKASHGAVRGMGVDIALTQQAQIGMMDQWLRNWRLNANSSSPPMSWMPDGQRALEKGLMPGMATPEEIAQLESASGPEVDTLFIDLMIKHHLGGIHMVDGILQQSTHPDVVWLAESMKTGQQGEISALQELRALVD